VQETFSKPFSKLLVDWERGDKDALNALLPFVYDDLRRMAHRCLQHERANHTIQSTALVHEAYLRLLGANHPDYKNRAHFFGVAAQMMRRILVDHARAHAAEKRGHDFQKLSLDDNIDKAVERSEELVALDDALNNLIKIDEQKARIVELRYFGGLSVEEAAEILGVTPITIKRHWRMTKAWLFGQMQKQ